MHGIVQDLAFTVRSYARQPAVTLVALTAMALGIGALTAVFSTVDAALLRPLPFAAPDELVFVWARDLEDGSERSVSFPDLEDWRAGRGDALADLVAVGDESFTLGATGGGAAGSPAQGSTAERIPAEWVSPGYFDLLGVRPAPGRAFEPLEPGAERSEPAVVIGHGLWQRRLGGRDDVLGSALRLNGIPFTVVGVAPPGFQGVGGEAELWAPIDLFDRAHPELAEYDILGGRGTRWLAAVGRLAPGVSAGRAEAALESVAARLRRDHPRANEGIGVRVVSAHDELAGHLRAPLGVLLAGAVLVLLIACANLAHVLLARNAARRSELAVRSALGAGRGRLIRQLLTETLLLTGVGGALGIGLAHWSIDLIAAAAAPALPPHAELGVDARTLSLALLATVVSGLLAGFLPAALGARSSLEPRPGSEERGPHRLRRLLSLLVSAETACAVGLLIAAGLMLASARRALHFEPGFATDGVLAARFELPADPQRQADLSRRLREEIAALPAVESAARASHVYFGGGYMSRNVTAQAEAGRQAEDSAYTLWVDPGFFATLGLPLLAGRDFSAADREGAPLVAVVNETFARRHWPRGSSVGRRVRYGGPEDADAPTVEVVGVVADVRQSLRGHPDGPPSQLYRPVEQEGGWARRLVVRTRGEPEPVIADLAVAAADVDPDVPIWDTVRLSELVRQSSAETRLLSWLLTAFSVLAAFLAATGVFGILAFTAERQRREIGVRLALGARRSEAGRRVLASGVAAAAIGIAIGLAVAWAGARLLAEVVYEVSPHDPAVFAGAALLVAVTVAAGAWLPARRATRLDPGTILREP